jgi:hypothetical protein
MKHLMVRYRVKPDRVAENQRLVEAIYAELGAKRPEGIRYATFLLDDGVTFIHLFSNERADGKNPLGETEAFKAFQAGLRDRCVEGPTPADMTEVGAYRMHGD